MKPDPTVKKETVYIAVFSLLCSVLMQGVFLVVGKWDYTVLLGNLLGWMTAVGNFFFMGLTVQRAVGEEPQQAERRVRASQSYRLICQGIILVLAAVLSCFHLVAAAVPLLFPRVAVQLRLMFNNKKDGGDAR